jgi:hypothetical protein
VVEEKSPSLVAVARVTIQVANSCGTNSHQKMDVDCGISGMVCVDDGNIVGNIEVTRY